MKLWFILLTSFIITSCQFNNNKTMQADNSSSFYVGTYTNTNSKGIYKYQLNADGSLQSLGLAVVSEAPSFLALSADKKFLLAVNEIRNHDGVGTVESFLINGDNLSLVNRSSSGGAHPCFIGVNKDGYVLAANYSGGNVALLKLNEKGELSELLDVSQHTGSGTTKRQEAPHAHSAWFDLSNNSVISIDLGTNELWFTNIDTVNKKLLFAIPQKLAMAEGAGPRHLDFHPNGKWIYILNELNGTVTQVLKSEKGEYKLGASISTLPDGYQEHNQCADIHVSSDGKFVYTSNRGHNSIAIFQVNMQDGTLMLVGHESTQGDWPRNFSLSLDEEYLVVANQNSNNIVSFKRDKTTGLLQYVDDIKARSPVCILFN